MDDRLVDLLGLRDLLAPVARGPVRGEEVPVEVDSGLGSMASDIDRATREWLEGASRHEDEGARSNHDD